MNNNLSSIMGSKLVKISDVSEHTGINRHTVANIYNQKNCNVQLSTLIKICDYLNISLSELIDYRPKESRVI